MQIQGPMGLMAMQIDGNADDGDMGQYEGDRDISPKRKVQQPEKHGPPRRLLHVVQSGEKNNALGALHHDSSVTDWLKAAPLAKDWVKVKLHPPWQVALTCQ